MATLGAVAVTLTAATSVIAQPATAVATNLECMTYSFDHYHIYCDLSKNGKGDFVTTDWNVNGVDYASNVNFISISCSVGVYTVAVYWTDSTGASGNELTKAVCGA
ncbi:MAG: hypothetical protein ACJ74U_01420 [Jatrophihabitantaceae bacterium]